MSSAAKFVVVWTYNGPVLPWFLPFFLHKTGLDCLDFFKGLSKHCTKTSVLRNRRDKIICCFLLVSFGCDGFVVIITIALGSAWMKHYFEIYHSFPVYSEMWRILILWFLGFRDPSICHLTAFGSQVWSALPVWCLMTCIWADAPRLEENHISSFIDPFICIIHVLAYTVPIGESGGRVFLRKFSRFILIKTHIETLKDNVVLEVIVNI